MSERDDKFRLDDESEGEDHQPGGWRSVPSYDPDVIAAESETVDERTVGERRGTAVERVAGRRPPPSGWPLEALTFPLRTPGPRTVILLAVLLSAMDLAERANVLLGLLLKLILLPVVLRWQFHTASTTAAGLDRPPTWSSAMVVRSEHIRGIGVLLGVAAITLVPGLLVLRYDGVGLGIALLVAAGVWVAAGALGQAVGQSSLIRPWNAVAWFVRHPVGLLLATVGWWAAGLVELWVGRTSAMPLLESAALGLGLRLGGVYLLLVSARVLGVVGRSWSAWSGDEAPG